MAQMTTTTCVAPATGAGDVVGDGADPLGVGHRGATELLHDERHGGTVNPTTAFSDQPGCRPAGCTGSAAGPRLPCPAVGKPPSERHKQAQRANPSPRSQAKHATTDRRRRLSVGDGGGVAAMLLAGCSAASSAPQRRRPDLHPRTDGTKHRLSVAPPVAGHRASTRCHHHRRDALPRRGRILPTRDHRSPAPHPTASIPRWLPGGDPTTEGDIPSSSTPNAHGHGQQLRRAVPVPLLRRAALL